MKSSFFILQILLAFLVSILVFFQSKGTGLSKSVASSAYHSRRGLEIWLFRLTILSIIAFVAISLWSQFITS